MHSCTNSIEFALSILLGENGEVIPDARRYVHYGSAEGAPKECRVVILPSGFLAEAVGGAGSVPELPLPDHDGLPVLFGQPGITSQAGRLVLHLDLVSATFFMLTRFEERLRPAVRDEHGRFPGRESLPVRAGWADRPIIDEYGKLLRSLLRERRVAISEPPESIRRIYLTHDIDRPFAWHRLRPALGEFGRRLKRGRVASAPVPLLTYLGLREADPNDSFDWLFEQDNALAAELGEDRVSIIYFVMAGGSGSKDGRYELRSRLVRKLLRRIRASGAQVGLHASYEAGLNPACIPAEAETLRKVTRGGVTSSRHHFLCWREPDDFEALLDAGIRHDYTMSFPDLAGFRLGTSRSFFWFDVRSQRPTALEVHPTTIMECTLDGKQNMNLSYEAARTHCERLVDATRVHNGDLTLLWHNTELTEAAAARGSYQRRLYEELLTTLAAN